MLRNKLLTLAFFALASFSSFAEVETPVIAVADIAISQASAKLVYEANAVRDVVTHDLTETGLVRVIDWSRLQAVLFRRNLQWSDVVDDSEQVKEIQSVLLNDYFLVGNITSYNEAVEFSGSAFSKSKSLKASLQMELFLKNAVTNEIVASERVQEELQDTVKQRLGFGAGRAVGAQTARKILIAASRKGVRGLLEQVINQNAKNSTSTDNNKDGEYSYD